MTNNGETITFGRMSDVLETPPFSGNIEPDSFRYNKKTFSDDNPIFTVAVVEAMLGELGEDNRTEALDALVREEVLSPEQAAQYRS